MNLKPLFCISLMLLTTLGVQAGPILITGTAADDSTIPNTPASPKIPGILINFDSLTSCATFPPSGCTNYSGTSFTGGVTISSPDGLYAIPFSGQTAPNELFDNSAQGSANIKIALAGATGTIGVGISDSDTIPGGPPVTIDLQALNSSGVGFGTLFTVTLPQAGGNPFNGYFVLQDTVPDIFGLQITQPVSNANFGGLAIDDVQVFSPEPSTILLLIGGVAMIGFRQLRQRA